MTKVEKNSENVIKRLTTMKCKRINKKRHNDGNFADEFKMKIIQ